MSRFYRIGLDIVIRKKPLFFRLVFARNQPKNHAMHMRFATGVRHPFKGAMRKGDFEFEALKQNRPKLRHLLALANGVCGDKADAGKGWKQHTSFSRAGEGVAGRDG